AEEIAEACLEDCKLRLPHKRIVDIALRAQLGQGSGMFAGKLLGGRKLPFAEKPVDIDIDRIEEPAIGGLIGTGALALARKHVMQWIDSGDCRSGLGGSLAEARQGLEIADAAIATAAQGIEMGGKAEAALITSQRIGEEAGPGCDNEPAAQIGRIVEPAVVIARG